MNPTIAKAPEVKNVGIGQTATLTLDARGTYRQVTLLMTMVKTSPTAGAAFDPTLSDVLNLFNLAINDKAGKRQCLAQQLNEIQTAWAANLAAVYLPQMDNNFNSVADSTETDNGVACTVRTGTWILRINFNEPSRDSYAARQFFGLPTRWNDNNGNTVATAKVQLQLTIGGPATVANYVPLTSMATGKYNLKNPAFRAEIVVDDGASGPFVGDQIVNGVYVHPAGAGYTQPMLPMTHWYRVQEQYTSTTPTILKNNQSLVGAVQQISIFSPNGSGDDVLTFQYKTNVNGATVTKLDTSKRVNDLLKLDNGWNPARIGSNSGDIAGTNWPQADVFHLAFDYDDNPLNAEILNFGTLSEFDIILTQNTATNKILDCIVQLYRDALTS